MIKPVKCLIIVACIALFALPILSACSGTQAHRVNFNFGTGGTVDVRIAGNETDIVAHGSRHAYGTVLMIRVIPNQTQIVKHVQAGTTQLTANINGVFTHRLTGNVTINVAFEDGCDCTCITGNCPCPPNCATCVPICECTCYRSDCPCPPDCPTCEGDPIILARGWALYVLLIVEQKLEGNTSHTIDFNQKRDAIQNAATAPQVNVVLEQFTDTAIPILVDMMVDDLMGIVTYINAENNPSFFDDLNRDRAAVRFAISGVVTQRKTSFEDFIFTRTELEIRTLVESIADSVTLRLNLNQRQNFITALHDVLWAMEACTEIGANSCGYAWCWNCG